VQPLRIEPWPCWWVSMSTGSFPSPLSSAPPWPRSEGLLIASHIGQINFSIGFLAGIKAFTAAVLGGIGSIPGAVLGSVVLGLTESFATGYVSSDYEDVFAFSLLVLILIFRPSGLLGKVESQKVCEAYDFRG
jgi:hypothetical protein